MAASDLIGVDKDAVTLTLAGETPQVFKSYDIKCSLFEQPSTFALRLGWGETARELMAKYPPFTPFNLHIGNQHLMTGCIDDPVVPGGKATELELNGRDNMAALANAYFESEESFRNSTFAELTRKAIDRVGLTGAELTFDNAANRAAVVGSRIVVRKAPRPPSSYEWETEEATATTQRTVYNTIKAQLGETELGFLRRQYKRAGLFLWATGDGNFVLSEPNAHQEPIYQLVRQRGLIAGFTNILTARFENRTKLRHSRAVVYGRGGGGKHGRPKVRGEYIDQEMWTWLQAQGRKHKPVVFHDNDIKSNAEAEFVARRKVAEERRRNRILEYTVSGHTAPIINQEGNRAVWYFDTVVDLQDDELGLFGPHYVVSVQYKRPPTTTIIRLVRPEDLVFAEEMEP